MVSLKLPSLLANPNGLTDYMRLEDFREKVDFIMKDEGLLAVLAWTTYALKRPLELLRQDAALLKREGRQKWGEMLLDQIPKEYHNRVPLLAAM